jgi:hypothetical protein
MELSGDWYNWSCQQHTLECCSISCPVEGLCEHNGVQIVSGDDHCAVLVDPSPSMIRQSLQASFKNQELSDIVFMVENEPICQCGCSLAEE